jgi:hypothetical protein
MAQDLISIWFIIDQESDTVSKVLMIGPLGLLIRKDSDWEFIERDESGINDTVKSVIYNYDWSSDTALLPDDFGDDDLVPEIVKKFDQGPITIADLDGVTNLYYDGTQEG